MALDAAPLGAAPMAMLTRWRVQHSQGRGAALVVAVPFFITTVCAVRQVLVCLAAFVAGSSSAAAALFHKESQFSGLQARARPAPRCDMDRHLLLRECLCFEASVRVSGSPKNPAVHR